MRTLLFNADYKVVKDPVHTSIELPSDFFTYIDDPLFQRLRLIKQTGLSHYVYPGLRHTRFEHSLGVAYLMLTSLDSIARNTQRVYGADHEATRIATRLSSKPEYRCAAGLAALLHDLGHLVWSHVFETALLDYFVLEAARREPTGFTITATKHEELTLKLAQLLLDKHEGVCGVKRDDLKTKVTYILKLAYMPVEENLDEEKLTLWVPARLLSGTVDVDRGDYLLRDSRSAGVSYGLYDLDRLINVMVIAWEPPVHLPGGARLDIGVVDKGVSVVENMLIGRMYMYSEVYLHDIVLAYEASAARLLALLLHLAALVEARGAQRLNGAEKRVLGCMVRLLSSPSAEDNPEEFEACARLLTDPSVEFILELLATGQSSIYDELGVLEDGKWLCPALRIYSRVLTERRHPSALYISSRNADAIIDRLRGVRALDPKSVRRNLQAYYEALMESPLPVLIYTSPTVYSPDEPVLVVNRRTRIAYRLEDLQTSALAELLRVRVSRSKIVLAYPGSIEELGVRMLLRQRQGKLSDEAVMKAFRQCGYSDQEAREVLSRLSTLLRETAQAMSDFASP